MPSVSSMISPPIEQPSEIPPWQKNRTQFFVLPTIGSQTTSLPMSSFLSEDRYSETPAPIPIECQLGPGTPSPSLPSRSPSKSPLYDPSEFLRLSFDAEYSKQCSKKRKISTDETKTPTKRYRRTKAEMIADRRNELMKSCRKVSIRLKKMKLQENCKSFRIFYSIDHTSFQLKPNVCPVPRMKLVPQEFSLISRMGFMRTQSKIALACMVEQCRFKSYQVSKLEKHFEDFHTAIETSFHCNLCNKMIDGDLRLELKHTIEEHIRKSFGDILTHPILYSKVRPKSRDREDLNRESESEEDEPSVGSDQDTDPESAAETEILSEEENDIQNEVEEKNEDSSIPENPTLEVISGDIPLDFKTMATFLDDVDDILAPSKKRKNSDYDSDFVPPSEPESEDDTTMKSDDEEEEHIESFNAEEPTTSSSSSLSESSESELVQEIEPKPKSNCSDRTVKKRKTRRGRKKSKKKFSVQKSVQKLRITRLNSGTQEESLSGKTIRTRRKSLALDKNLIVQSVESGKVQEAVEVTLPLKRKRGRKKKKQQFGNDAICESENPTQSKDNETKALPEVSTENSWELEKEKKEIVSAEKSIKDSEFLKRIPPSVVERIKQSIRSKKEKSAEKEQVRKSIGSEVLNATSLTGSPTQQLAPENADKQTENTTDSSELQTKVSSLVQFHCDKDQEVSRSKVQVTTKEIFETNEHLLFMPTTSKHTITKAVCEKTSKDSSVRLKEIEIQDDLRPELNSSKMEFEEVEAEDITKEPGHTLPVAAKDFPALIVSPKKPNFKETDSTVETDDIFYDSQDFVDEPQDTDEAQDTCAGNSNSTFIEAVNLAKLYPWIDDDITEKVLKAKYFDKALLDENCLFSTYKCMSIDCSYHSIDKKEFKEHLKEKHENDATFVCSFCLCEETDPGDLITHIKEFHSRDRYQCSLCMYRSCEKFYCDIHQKKFHPNVQASILKSPVIKCFIKTRQAALETEKLQINEEVKPFKCNCKYIEILGVVSVREKCHFALIRHTYVELDLLKNLQRKQREVPLN
jgi:hypothetical protein